MSVVAPGLSEEERLRESESRLRFACDAANVGIWDWDLVSDVIVYSDTVKKIFGFPLAEPLTFEMVRDATHPEDYPRTDAMAQRALDPEVREKKPFEYRIVRPDGQVRWVVAYGEAVFAEVDGNTRAVRFAGTIQDVTEAKQITDALRASEERLRLALDGGQLAVWEFDPATNSVTGSPEFNRILGFPEDASPTMDEMMERYVPGERERVRAVGREAFESGRNHFEVEYRFLRLDGEVRWALLRAEIRLDPDGRPKGALGILMDVTDRKEAEIALLDREERLSRQEAELRRLNETLEQKVAERTQQRDLMWRLSQDLFVIMGADGVVRAVNPVVESLGFRVEEVVGRCLSEFVHPEDLAHVAEAMARAGHGPQRDVETRQRTADGSYRWFSWSATTSEDAIYAVGRDVTDDKAQHQALALAEDALRHSQKMEAMGQLTGGVAHDFNNLLTPIIAGLDMLQRRGLGSAQDQRLIDGALQSADRARALVQRLLAFARRQPLQPSPVDLGQLVGGMRDLIASTCGPRTTVHVHVEEGAPPAQADPNQLEMALLNLAVNARDAMPDGGRLEITVDRSQIQATDDRLKLSPGDYVRLSVSDTGVGMDEETMRRAVEPFFSTKGVGQGTGLGLSMAHGLAAQLGGALVLSSKPGLGTRAELWLPVAQGEPARNPGSEGSGAIKGVGTALLVDDDELVRASTAHMLAELGFEVVEAAAADQALASLASLPRVDLLVTDHLMKGMTGADLAREVLDSRPDTRVLIITGYADADAIAPDLPRLAKPFRQTDLAQAIAKLTRRPRRSPALAG